jgi:hypothetical protein
MTAPAAETYAGRWEPGPAWTCPLDAGRRLHTRAEHRALTGRIMFPLVLQDWTDPDGYEEHGTFVSVGHHPAARFWAAVAADTDGAEAMTQAVDYGVTLDLVPVQHVWKLWRPGYLYEDGEPVGHWRDVPRGTGGAVPFTVVEL